MVFLHEALLTTSLPPSLSCVYTFIDCLRNVCCVNPSKIIRWSSHHTLLQNREGGTYVTSRWEGNNSCTLAQHPSSCPPFMQQLAKGAGHVLAFKRFISTVSINRNRLQSHYFLVKKRSQDKLQFNIWMFRCYESFTRQGEKRKLILTCLVKLSNSLRQYN